MSAEWLTWLLHLLARLSIVLAAAWLLSAWLGRANPRWRILLWRCTAIGLLGTTALNLCLPAVQVGLPLMAWLYHPDVQARDRPRARPKPPTAVPFTSPALREITSDATQPPIVASDSGPTTGFSNNLNNAEHKPNAKMVATAPARRAIQINPASTKSRSSWESAWTLPALLFVVWLLGAILGLAKAVVGSVRIAGLWKRASDVPPWVEAEAVKAAAAIGYLGRLEIRRSGELEMPCSLGLARPGVLLPSRQCQGEVSDELRASLAHEIAHLKGRDLRWNGLLHVVSILLWWHPLAWRIRLAHADACDERCDAQAAGYLSDPDLYAKVLARLALLAMGRSSPTALAMARTSHVKRRIAALHDRIRWERLPRIKAAVAAGAAMLVILALGIVSVNRSSAEVASTTETAPQAKADEDQPMPSAEGAGSWPIYVTDEATGEPLTEAKIKYVVSLDRKRIDLTLETDRDGVAKLDARLAAKLDRVMFTVIKPGFVPVHYQWMNDMRPIDLPPRVDVKLVAGRLIGGVVQDDVGNPIAGASVRLSMPITWPRLASHIFTFAELTTNEKGRWSFNGVPDDLTEVGIRVTHPEFLKGGKSAAAGIDNAITLKKGLRIAGRVTDAEGKPIADAIARFGYEHGIGAPTGKSDADGRFALDNCVPGKSLVTIQAEGFAPQFQEVVVGEQKVGVEFRLEPGQTLRVQVVDPTGAAISDATVVAWKWRGYSSLDYRAQTDAEGRVVWRSAPTDGVVYNVLARGYVAARDAALAATSEEQRVTLYPTLKIGGRVTDAASGEGVKSFQIRAGQLLAGSDRPYWGANQSATYSDGTYSYSFDEQVSGLLLEVSATGYRPRISRVFLSNEGRVAYDFALEPGKGPSGIVLTPDGAPVVGAQVALATRERQAYLRGGSFERDHSSADFVETNGEGRFEFLAQDDEPFLIIVVDDLGYAEVTGENLARSDRIVVAPWGRLTGRVLRGDKPDAGCEVSFWPTRPEDGRRGEFITTYDYKAKTDADGRFAFDRVIPRPGTATRTVVTKHRTTTGYAPGWHSPVDIREGETTDMTIGGSGRAVNGRVVLDRSSELPIDWTVNDPVRIEAVSDGDGRGRGEYVAYLSNIDKSGAFVIPDVPAGTYRLGATVNNPPAPNACGAGDEIGRGRIEFVIPEIPGGRSDEPFDLGDVTATLFDTLDAGEVAPEFAAERLTGGPMRLSDLRGKLVVLDFWATWCDPCLAEMPVLKAVHEKFKGDPRFALVSLSCDNEIDSPKRFVEENKFAWLHAHVAGHLATAMTDYTVRSLPASFLIAPDGRILAKNLRGEALWKAVEAALGDETLFDAPQVARQSRFTVTRFDVASAPPSESRLPAALAIENTDTAPGAGDGRPVQGTLRWLDASGETLHSVEELDVGRSGGGVHCLAVDRERNRVYLCERRANRVVAFDDRGAKIWQVQGVPADTILVDEKTGHVWVSGGPLLNSGETVVFDGEGHQVAAYPYRAIDMDYDPHSDAFWLVGYQIIKLSREGEVLFRENVYGWCCGLVSVNRADGRVWIAESASSDTPRSKNRLWLRGADGAVLQKLDLGEESPVFALTCEARTGDALYSSYNAPLKRVTAEGVVSDFLDVVDARSISANAVSGEIWVATDTQRLKLSATGAVEMKKPFDKPSSLSTVVGY